MICNNIKYKKLFFIMRDKKKMLDINKIHCWIRGYKSFVYLTKRHCPTLCLNPREITIGSINTSILLTGPKSVEIQLIKKSNCILNI